MVDDELAALRAKMRQNAGPSEGLPPRIDKEKIHLLAPAHAVNAAEVADLLDRDAASVQQRDETELQLTVAQVRKDEELSLLASEPPQLVEAPSGIQVDMRPPELQIRVAELDYMAFHEAGLYADSVRRLVARLAYAKLVHGKESAEVVKAQLTLAKAYLELQDLPKQALQHTAEAHALFVALKRARQLAANPMSRMLLEAELLAVLGVCHCRLGKSTTELARAEQHLRHAVVMYSQVPGRRDHTLEQQITRGMGEVCAKQRKFAVAAEYLRHAAQLVADANGPDDHELIGLYQKLGAAESYLEHEAETATAFAKARELIEAQHGATSVERAETSVVHAKALMRMGKEDSAEAELSKALAICLGHLGHSAGSGPAVELMAEEGTGEEAREATPLELRVLQIQDELVGAMIRSERYKPAVRLLKSLLASKCRAFGSASLAVAKGHRLFGNVRLAQGKINLGIKHLKQAQRIFQKELGRNHAKTKAVDQTLIALGSN